MSRTGNALLAPTENLFSGSKQNVFEEETKRSERSVFSVRLGVVEAVPQHAPLRVAVKRLIGQSSSMMLAMPGPTLYRESCYLVCRILFTAMPDRAVLIRETDFQILVRTGLIEMGAV